MDRRRGSIAKLITKAGDIVMNMSRNVFWGLVVSAMLVAGVSQADEGNSDAARARIGLSIAPVSLDLRHKNPLLVGLGSYIINAQGSCNDCHTHPNFAPGGDPYLNQPEVINAATYLSGGRQFGPFTAPNLTPDANGLPGGMTFAAFRNAVRTGKDPDGSGGTLQVMPWYVVGKMSDYDLRAIYEYLKAIPSLPDNPAPGPSP